MQPLKDSIPNAELVARRYQESLWKTKDGIFVALSKDSYTDFPVLYHDGRVGWDYPEQFSKAFRAMVRAIMNGSQAKAANQ